MYVVEQYEEVICYASDDDWFLEPGEEYTEKHFCGYEIISEEELERRREFEE